MQHRHYGLWGWGLLLGLLATAAGLAVAELMVGLVRGSASPIVPVGQEVIDAVPRALKDWAIETFGTADKAVLVIGGLFVLALLGAVVGTLAIRGQLAAAIALTVAVGAAGAAAVVARPAPTFLKLLPSIVGTVTSIAVLWWLAPRRQAEPLVDPAAGGPTMGVDRRAVLHGAVAVGSLAAISGGLGRLLQRRFDVAEERAELVLPDAVGLAATAPADAELGVGGITPFITPNSDFYRIDTVLVVPQVRRSSWRLRITGMVERELEIDFDDLLARPQIERLVTLSCVSNPVGGDLVGTARWQGARLADLLAEAGVQPGAEQLVSRSIDGWTCGTPLEAVLDGREAMLAVAMNGEPLPPSHGYPVRIVVPGLYGYVSATKWLTELELTTWDAFDAYWVPRGWSKQPPAIKITSRIDTPRRKALAGTVMVGGVAWAVHRGISSVDVRVDGGEWRTAELGGVPSDDTWRQWAYAWDAAPGRHTLEVRATDRDGVVQIEERRPVAPDGASGYHRVELTVS